jgi:glycosyltransferase involved in cell wall biosynthesis
VVEAPEDVRASVAPALDAAATASKYKIGLVARREPGVTGTSRYAGTLLPELEAVGVEAELLLTSLPPGMGRLASTVRRLGIDLESFFGEYPLRLSRRDVDVYHFSAQTFATLLMVQRFDRPVVVTVHDIIPYLTRGNRRLGGQARPVHRWVDDLAMQGLKRATLLIADSAWTKGSLVAALAIPPERIHVVHLGVDHERFRPLQVSDAFRRKYGLESGARHLLYVGSEDPRKNLETLLRAFALIRGSRQDVRLVKVGAAHHLAEHARLEALAHTLGIESAIRWTDHVPEEDLPLFYSVADVVVLPSHYEGFGFPVLEAMACGTPVVCNDATSLTELAGQAAVLVRGGSAAFADAIGSLLDDSEHRRRVRERGLSHAARFRWESTARATRVAYTVALERGIPR